MVSGKEFREVLRKNQAQPRIVEPFSIEANKPNTIVKPPPRTNLMKPRNVNFSQFRKYFLRGDLPIAKKQQKDNKKTKEPVEKTEPLLQWTLDPLELDYSYYLPIFVDGLCESEDPFKSLARDGVTDMLTVGGHKVLCVIPQLITPLKNALNTRNMDIIIATLKVIQHLMRSDPCVGLSFVPYYRQLLPICNMFKHINVNIGGAIDQTEGNTVGDVIERTLQMLEQYGGPNAYINIKYMVPTYESVVLN